MIRIGLWGRRASLAMKILRIKWVRMTAMSLDCCYSIQATNLHYKKGKVKMGSYPISYNLKTLLPLWLGRTFTSTPTKPKEMSSQQKANTQPNCPSRRHPLNRKVPPYKQWYPSSNKINISTFKTLSTVLLVYKSRSVNLEQNFWE